MISVITTQHHLKCTIQEIIGMAGKAKNNYCCARQPLLHIDLEHVVIVDKLHLSLRIVNVLIPKRTAQSFIPGKRVLIPPGYLHPGKGKHQQSLKFINNRRRVTMIHGWTSLISKIWLFVRSGISKISIFNSIYLENHISYNEL